MPAAMALARGGLCALGLVDPETVELSNLARQVIYRVSDVGRPKAQAAAERLAVEFPSVSVEPLVRKLDSGNALALIEGYDFVIDGTDNPAVKFLINYACLVAHKPLAYGGVLGLRGQAMTVIPGRTACLRCLFEEPPGEDEGVSCRDAGIIGPVAGAIGILEAAEAETLMRGGNPELAGRMLTFDSSGLSRIRITPVRPRQGCGCGAAAAAPAPSPD